MFSDIKPNLNDVDRDFNKIMTIIKKYKKEMERILKIQNRVHLHSLIRYYEDALYFPLNILAFEEHWDLILIKLSEELGLNVYGCPVYDYDVDRDGNKGLLQLIFKLKD